MEFLKKHYEKIILSVVLLALAAVAVWLPSFIQDRNIEISQQVPAAPPPKPIETVDVTQLRGAMSHLTNPPPVILSGAHNTFNPVTWKRKADGTLLKIIREGPDALEVTNTTPLYTVIAYDRPGNNGAGYYMTTQVLSGRKNSEFVKLDEKVRSGLFILRGIKGATESPDALELEITSQTNHVFVTKDQPFKQVDGYTADLKYDPEPELQGLSKKHVNDTITLNGEAYKIIYITNNAVRVLEPSTDKRTTIKYNASTNLNQ